MNNQDDRVDVANQEIIRQTKSADQGGKMVATRYPLNMPSPPQAPEPPQTLSERATSIRQNGQTPEELAVAHGIANYQRVIAERDDLARRLDAAEKLATVHKIEIESLRVEKSQADTRVVSYQQERDVAVARLASANEKIETFQKMFGSLVAIMRTFGIEHAPLLRKREEQ